jgi:hypothetical protein
MVVGGEEGMEETLGMEGVAVDVFWERGEGEECQRERERGEGGERCVEKHIFLDGRLTV